MDSQPSSEDEGTFRGAVRFVMDDGLELVGDAHGDSAAPPVLLLHGGGQTRHAWKNTARVLADAGYYAVALDLRGHGDSGWCERGDYTFQVFAEDLRCVAGQMDGAVAMVGASLGGLAALICEGEMAPGQASAVVLVDIAPRMDSQGVERIVAFMKARPDGFASLEEAADEVARYLPHRRRPPSSEGLARNLRQGEDGRWRWHWDPDFLTSRGTPEERENFHDRLMKAAASLEVPTLLVRGGMSEIVSEEGAREFLNVVPHAEYVDVEKASHMVAGDRNDEFCSAVVEFLSRTVPA
jgi:pimeloyl-ACP methyl ester carboxylesterase